MSGSEPVTISVMVPGDLLDWLNAVAEGACTTPEIALAVLVSVEAQKLKKGDAQLRPTKRKRASAKRSSA